MNIKLLLFITLLSTLIWGCAQNTKSEGKESVTTAQLGQSEDNAKADALPKFSIKDASGNVVSLQSFKGKKVFVNLWASWCPPCRREMPSIEKLYQHVDTSKVAFVMLSLDDHFDKAKGFIKSKKLELPIYYPADNLPPLFNVQGIPATFIFNEHGALIEQINGGDDYNTDYYKTLLK